MVTPPPIHCPTPSPTPLNFNSDASITTGHNMLVSVLLALFLPCVEKGLSSSELEKLPKVTGKELGLGTECAVCLDDIESEQLARIVPGCNHGFHLECADTWLSKHPVCPVCRAKLDDQFSTASASPENNPC
ncbi:PREDICTED: E3 ubiquitin-protein ligase ATL23-like [Populus euphratica]|uniref:E3 ubiquitin-protein ligase ATL23-like n=1 Tax=Populus euphratica TaxID=75702 RepID=A0AAJ6UT16_POPEU|nr:PREDICTED: E3 ubiquitin-protein ligase ATL23-like [Populus euphratica]